VDIGTTVQVSPGSLGCKNGNTGLGDKRVEQSKEAKFYRIVSRAWEFRAPLSHRLGTLGGPLRFGLSDHDIDRFVELRIRSIFYENFGGGECLRQKGVDQRWHQ
jgi:hypothetical protein